jgi:hypothetical protein
MLKLSSTISRIKRKNDCEINLEYYFNYLKTDLLTDINLKLSQKSKI